MVIGEILPKRFYDREVVQVARDLLGARLVRRLNGERISGIITECEAYDGMQDLACHAKSGKTNRNALNVVAGAVDYPAAVLIRAIEPMEGMAIIAENRPQVNRKNWTNGPAKLTQALQVKREQNGVDMTSQSEGLWIESGWPVAEELVKSGTRIGIDSTPEPWRSMPWRFWFNAPQHPEMRTNL